MKQESGGVGTGEQLYCCEHESNQGQRENASGRVTHSKNGKAGWTLTVTEQGGHELLKRMNQEAGDASEGLVSCTVQICAAHTPQTFLEIRLFQSGFGPDQACMCCSFGVCDPAGPYQCSLTNLIEPTSYVCEVPKVNIEDCSFLPSYWLQEP